MKTVKRQAKKRKQKTFRVRNQVRRVAHGRPRLSVFRSRRHMYAQVIDDESGRTLVSASTVEPGNPGAGNYAGNREAAARVGKLLAERAMEKGIKQVVFDRGRYRYHGRVAAVADAAREAGMEF